MSNVDKYEGVSVQRVAVGRAPYVSHYNYCPMLYGTHFVRKDGKWRVFSSADAAAKAAVKAKSEVCHCPLHVEGWSSLEDCRPTCKEWALLRKADGHPLFWAAR